MTTSTDKTPEEGSCCGGTDDAPCCGAEDSADDTHWIVDSVCTPVGSIPRISTKPDVRDFIGTVRVRLCIGRMNYRVPPGIYATGSPTPESPVLVSANYKLSFDALRKELTGIDAWILVIDTNGINVWCAAGKGTFGTDEIVARIGATKLSEVVSHHKIILPQLGAPGVAAHEVRKQTGFSVVYGPVLASDVPAFLSAGNKATTEMRRIRFGMVERLLLVPVELVEWGKFALIAGVALLLLSRILGGEWIYGLRAGGLVILAYLCGGIFVPVFLPWLPGSSFSSKGAVVGFLLVIAAYLGGWLPYAGTAAKLESLAWLLVLPSISSFVGMNFTGAATFTSLSGVKREMRLFVPAQLVASLLGLGLGIAAIFTQ
jgi:hypothetical protein